MRLVVAKADAENVDLVVNGQAPLAGARSESGLGQYLHGDWCVGEGGGFCHGGRIRGRWRFGEGV